MNNFADAIIINRRIGIDELVIPFSLEFMIHEDNKGEIYEYLINKLQFKKFIESSIKSLEYYESNGTEIPEKEKNEVISKNKKLTKQYENCKTIITIKLELQKYE